MNDLIYEKRHFARPKLAQSYLTPLRDGSGDPICLQAPPRLIFTSSNQDRLRELFGRSRAALYEGASMLSFPALGDDFSQFVADRIHDNLRCKVLVSDVTLAFERFQH